MIFCDCASGYALQTEGVFFYTNSIRLLCRTGLACVKSWRRNHVEVLHFLYVRNRLGNCVKSLYIGICQSNQRGSVETVQAFRFPWESEFPAVVIHSSESAVKQHPNYPDAKAGDVDAAVELVRSTLSDMAIESLIELGKFAQPILVSVHAEESVGVNAIPEVMADFLAAILGWEVEGYVVQANVVNHTGANGFARLARQAIFSGEIIPARKYVIVDDFIGQGGTIANLRGHILSQGGAVLGATVLTGKSYSAILQSEPDRLAELRRQHGQIEDWWNKRFGFSFDCLTASEVRYLLNTSTSETICSRIAEADADC